MKNTAIISFFLALLASCNGNVQYKSTQIEQKFHDTISDTETEVKSILKEQEEPERNISKWQYEQKKDPMTDELSYTATLSSNERQNIDGVNSKMDILIFYNQGDNCTAILLGLENGRHIRQNMPLLKTRFDKEEPKLGTYFATQRNVAVVASYIGSKQVFGSHDWLNNLRNSKTLAVEIELENGSTATYTFDISGLKWRHV
ncbi:MAG: hypothetical protein J1F07_06715 [Muribaculaceae bacterium]|nr:hypothetical protein [Muribaculaceae bacterium]